MNAAQALAKTITDDVRRIADRLQGTKIRIALDNAKAHAPDFDPPPNVRLRMRRQSSMREFETHDKAEPFGLPVLGGRISGRFGMRFHPVDEVWKAHEGLDIAAPVGLAVTATAPGRVTFAGSMRGYGKLVTIQHPAGRVTYYAHLSEILVEVGDTVGRGHVIGEVGATGKATGPHVHYEVRIGGEPVDPEKFLGQARR